MMIFQSKSHYFFASGTAMSHTVLDTDNLCQPDPYPNVTFGTCDTQNVIHTM